MPTAAHAPSLPLLMDESPEALRRKLQGATGLLGRWWQHYLALAREDGNWFCHYSPMAYLVTGDAAFADLTRASFAEYAESEPEANLACEPQFHTHVTAAPLARLVALYDWIADLDVLSPAESQAFAAAAINHCHKFPMQQLHGRTLTGFDNQVMSNAFCCALVGYAFGFKRGNDPLAQRMFSLGLSWLRALFLRAPSHGYSLEGSTYNEQVATPVALMSAILYQQITGHNVYQHGLPPDGPPIRRMVELAHRMVSPNGLLPPWDAYGYQRLSTRMLLVWLARQQRDPQPLRVIRDVGAWPVLDHPAWECDDRTWSLAWWPEGLDWEDGQAQFPAWMRPEIAGALQDRATNTRLFQFWDRCGGMPYCGRPETNPNAIALEAHGAALLLDGHGKVDEELTPIPAQTILDYAGKNMLQALTWGASLDKAEVLQRAAQRATMGHVGISNSLVFDGEDWYCPLQRASGEGIACEVAGPLQVIASEARDYYTDRYDVDECRRTTALLPGRWCIALDRVRTKTDHEITWQAFTPVGASAETGRALVEAPDGVALLLIPEDGATPQIAAAPDFPERNVYANGSSRVRFPGATANGRYDRAVCLVPYPTLEPWPELAAGFDENWTADFGDGNAVPIGMREAVLDDPCANIDRPRKFRKQIELAQFEGDAYLRLAFASCAVVCRVNGQPARRLYKPQPDRWEHEGLASSRGRQVFSIGEHLQAGANTIELESPSWHGETVAGPIELLRPIAAHPEVEFEPLGGPCYRIARDGATDHLVLDNRNDHVEIAGARTDAAHALLDAAGNISLVGMTRFELPGQARLASRAPANIALNPPTAPTSVVTLDSLTDNNTLDIDIDGARVRIESTGWLHVSRLDSGSRPVRLRVRGDVPRPIILNGEATGWLAAGEWTELEIAAANNQIEDSLLAAAEGDDDDWEQRLVAIDRLGLVGTEAAGARLLQLLEQENELVPDPPLKHWWRYSKMLHEPGPATPDTETPVPQGAKRWRLRRALATALGNIGHQPAVPTLTAMLERNQDFFACLSQVPVALGRLGAASALPALRRRWDHPEINIQVNVRLAVRFLDGEIPRADFESGIGPG